MVVEALLSSLLQNLLPAFERSRMRPARAGGSFVQLHEDSETLAGVFTLLDT